MVTTLGMFHVWGGSGASCRSDWHDLVRIESNLFAFGYGFWEGRSGDWCKHPVEEQVAVTGEGI